MSESFVFELVSPEKLLLSKSAVMVTVPGSEGDYGVLAGHAPLITTVRTGVIDVYEKDDKTISDRIFVAGGFAEVNASRCTVLAEEAVPVSDIDRGHVESAIQELSGKISASESESERAALSAELAVAHAKLQVITAAH